MSQVVSGKKYRKIEYLFAISISLGMTLFLMSERSNKIGDSKVNQGFSGLFVLVLYLLFDSFTSNWQGKLFEKYQVSTWQMMAAVNFYSILLTSTSLTQQGDLSPALKLVFSSWNLLVDCLLLSFCSAAGQLFVFHTISKFGALVFVTIMTLRQAFAILLSCVIYHHILKPVGIFGILLVFVTLFSQIYWKSANKGKK